MKKTQMIHSPRTFKFGLGLMLAASLASMPVLTGANERQDAKTAAAAKKRSSVESGTGSQASSKAKRTKKQTLADSANEKTAAKADGGARKAKPADAEDRARERIGKLEREAKKITAQLSSSERKKLLALINDSKTGELATIRGIGKSRSTAIENARPIESIEDLPKLKGIGLKTLADVVDHGRGVTPGNTRAPKPSPSDSEAGRSEDARKGTTASKEKSTKKA